MIYMMLTTSNAVKFEQKGSKERETVDDIVQGWIIYIMVYHKL